MLIRALQHGEAGKADELPAMLAFIARHGFSPRTEQTWHALSMGAITAWEGNTLLGAIPYEPRRVMVNETISALSWHETSVAVDPAYRGRGIGTALQDELARRAAAGGADIITVFREDPACPAYQWYLNSGFAVAVRVESYCLDLKPSSKNLTSSVISSVPSSVTSSLSLSLAQLSSSALERLTERPGEISRSWRAILPWLQVHPYASRYRFEVLEVPDGFALVGRTSMHSPTERGEILLSRGDPAAVLTAARAWCQREGLTPLRWPVAQADSAAVAAAVGLGMQSRWTFDLLVKPLKSGLNLDTKAWRYAGIDFA